MGNTSSAFADALRSLAEESQDQQAAHLSPEELLAYRQGELYDREIDRVQGHLALCRTCARAALDLVNFPNLGPVDKDQIISDRELDSEWEAMQDRLDKKSGVLRFFPMLPPAIVETLAASFFVAALGLSFWIYLLSDGGPSHGGPILNPRISDLKHSTNRGGASPQVIRVGRQEGGVLLIFHLTEVDELPAYAGEITNEEGRVIWHSDKMIKNEYGDLTLMFLHSSLPSGRYIFTVYKPDPLPRESLNVFPFEIQFHES